MIQVTLVLKCPRRCIEQGLETPPPLTRITNLEGRPVAVLGSAASEDALESELCPRQDAEGPESIVPPRREDRMLSRPTHALDDHEWSRLEGLIHCIT